MSELAERYRAFSGLLFINVDEQIRLCDPDKLHLLYRKLVWNLHKGRRLTLESRQGKEFAWIICNLAIKCSINPGNEDIIPDGILNYDDFISHYELEFAHKVIQDCEHIDKIISYLIGENSDKVGFILEEGVGRIILEK